MKIEDLVLEGVALVKGNGMKIQAAARQLISQAPEGITLNALRQRISSAISDPESVKKSKNNKAKTKKKSKKDEPEPFVLCAWDFDTGKMMDIDQYCSHYNLPRENVFNYRLVSHTGTPFYNISFKETVAISSVDFESLRSVLEAEIEKTYVPVLNNTSVNDREGVLKWADLHFGAHIRNLVLTPDYDSEILSRGLHASVDELNSRGFKKTHVHINGDLIESLSGLNHINSWMSMDKEQTGANAIKLCAKLLDQALSRIDNLDTIKIIGGNHDRLSKNNDEEVKGGAADLIAYCLELMGYNVEFNPYIITHQVEGITHINLHGDKVLSKRPTKDICWQYGKKGTFNFVFEAHLHSIIEKLSVNQLDKKKITDDDGVDHRRMHLPSFFTGNYYSETLGFGSNAGYVIVSDNGRGKPNVSICSL